MDNKVDLYEREKVKSYVLGFLLSLLLTLTAYFSVRYEFFSAPWLLYFIVGLAFLQFFVQLILFLDLGKESKPQWRLIIFLFMVSVVVILVAGSIWIMDHLNYNVMPRM